MSNKKICSTCVLDPRDEARRVHEVLGHGLPDIDSPYARTCLVEENRGAIAKNMQQAHDWNHDQALLFLAFLGLLIASDFAGSDASAYKLFETLDDVLLPIAQAVFAPRKQGTVPHQPIATPTLDTTGAIAAGVVEHLVHCPVLISTSDRLSTIEVSSYVLTSDGDIDVAAKAVLDNFEPLP